MDPTSIHPPTPPPPPATAATTTTLSFPAISAAVPFTLEPNNHVPASSAPLPIPNPSADSNHPPYSEMIYTAIGALKEKNGSSKRAIAKYIEQVYRDHLPPSHDALLTHHLNRLKSSGLLLMVKKSYKLPSPRSDPLAPASAVTATATAPQPHRSRGRPPKPKLNPQAQVFPLQQSLPVGNEQQQQQNAEPVWAALGLADEPTAAAVSATDVKKRGPGRPRKIGVAGVGPVVPVRRGRPPGPGRSRLPKRPGRPPKPKSVSAISSGLKRRPGRPPKIQSKPTLIPFAAPAPAASASAPGLPAVLAVSTTVATASVPMLSPRPRGRPKKNAAAVPGLPVVVAAARGRGRGRGRGVLLKPKNSTGRPVGRPKGTTSATTLQKAANEDLKRKLEYFQTKVKESLGDLKPYFNHESPVTAIAAIQELEILATMDLKAPLRDETQQLQQLPPPPSPLQQQLPPQQLPLPQIFQQQFPQMPSQPQLQQLFQPQASAPS